MKQHAGEDAEELGQSPLSRGARIETPFSVWCGGKAQGRPSHEGRGLKPHPRRVGADHPQSPLSRGARIETHATIGTSWKLAVAPLTRGAD